MKPRKARSCDGATAFSPASITLIFAPRSGRGKNALPTSSPGVSICLSLGVTAVVKSSGEEGVFLNSSRVDFPWIQVLLNQIGGTGRHIELTSPIPLGFGFGLSAAILNSMALAVIETGTPLSKERALELVQNVEIEYRNGIADAGAQYLGGVVLRGESLKPEANRRLNVLPTRLYLRTFEPKSTPKVLTDAVLCRRIRKYAAAPLAQIHQLRGPIPCGKLIDIAYDFAKKCGNLFGPRVWQTVEQVRAKGGSATPIFLGESVVSTQPLDDENWIPAEISTQGSTTLLCSCTNNTRATDL